MTLCVRVYKSTKYYFAISKKLSATIKYFNLIRVETINFTIVNEHESLKGNR
jgi:hypothetical protein